MTAPVRAFVLSVLSLASFASPSARAAAAPAETKLRYHGHAAFEILTPKGKTIFIDPWLKNPANPAARNGQDPVAKTEKADYILATHGHSDHVGDAVALAKKTKARLIAPFELGQNMAIALGYPADQVGIDTLGNAGGELTIADGEVTVAFTPAVHSSGLDADSSGKQPMIFGGNAVGYVVRIKGGPTIYHSGDTAYFRDMEEIGEKWRPDVALLNIGGHFGMQPDAAAKAAKAVRAGLVIPHHFKTFPILTQSSDGFFKLLDAQKTVHREMEPGSTLAFVGAKLKP